MAKLIYASNVSLDGCTEDEHGAFDWAAPDDEVFAFVTNLIGKPALPTDMRADLELLDEGRFSNGVVHLHYRASALDESGRQASG